MVARPSTRGNATRGIHRYGWGSDGLRLRRVRVLTFLRLEQVAKPSLLSRRVAETRGAKSVVKLLDPYEERVVYIPTHPFVLSPGPWQLLRIVRECQKTTLCEGKAPCVGKAHCAST